MDPTSEKPIPESCGAEASKTADDSERPDGVEESSGGVCPICQRHVRGDEPTRSDDDPEGQRTVNDSDPEATVADAAMADGTIADGDESVLSTLRGFGRNEPEDHDAIEYLFPDRERDRLGQWGPYEIQHELGHGGMGIVFKVFDSALCRHVAIKIMRPALAASARSRSRFVRESRTMAAFIHTNIVAIHAVSEHKGIPFLVMELVPGEGLDQRILRLGPLPVADVLNFGAQIAEGLKAAHAHGTIHRDIKPGNVMVGPGDSVKISDFGLALVMLENPDLTPADHRPGTPKYMAPEVIRGKPVDARVDLYGLGCTIHAMATGEPPFTGKNIIEIARRVCDEAPRRLDEINPAIPRPLADLTLRLLEKDPDDRIQTAAEVAAALRGMLAGRELNILNAAPPAPRVEQRTTRRRRRPRLRLWTTGGLLAASVMLYSTGRLPWRPSWTPALGLLSSTWSSGAVDPESSPSAPDRAPWSPPVVTDPPPLKLPEPSTTPMELEVSTNSPAHFKSLAKAIAYATPGSTINVLEGEYQESILIDDPDRLRGLTIEAAKGAVLRGPAGAITVLDLKNTRDVVIRGLTIRCSTTGQHGIRLFEDVSGALLEQVRVEQVKDAPAAVIHVAPGAHGSPGAPARLRKLDVDVGRLGIVLGGSGDSQTVSHIHLENSWIHGDGASCYPIVLETSVHDTVISGNIIEGADNGIGMALTDINRPARLEVRNNTFRNCNAWVNLSSTDAKVAGIDIARNLVVDCDSVATRLPELNIIGPDLNIVGPIWFRENVWWTRGAENAGLVARVVDPAQLLSLNPQSPDYLRPADPASATLKDKDTDESFYAGAVDPQPASSKVADQTEPRL